METQTLMITCLGLELEAGPGPELLSLLVSPSLLRLK